MPSDLTVIARAPLTVHVAGTPLSIPYRPAAVWAQALNETDRCPVVATLADDTGRALLADLIIDHPQAVDDLRRESLRILGEAANRKWWETGRLLSVSVTPEVLGRLVLAGVDPWSRSLGEWCAAVYALCVKGADDKKRLRFDFSLSVPPPGHEDEWDDGGDDPEATMEAVQALMGRKG